jgi:hypothetical protein
LKRQKADIEACSRQNRKNYFDWKMDTFNTKKVEEYYSLLFEG